ncbi:MAG: lamin tail domain-containing protein [Thermomicrobiales bacterium]|nr:lamin tail domain-containing protein [Thermomicrobiales bacterium]
MSDSAQWWTIGLLVAFMVIGLAMIFLSRGQKDVASSRFVGNGVVASGDETAELLASGSTSAPTSADVTHTRLLYATEAVADGVGDAAAKSAALSSIDVTAVEDAGMAATLAAGGDLPETEQPAPAVAAAPSVLTTEPAIPVVGTELSERDWATTDSPAEVTATLPVVDEAPAGQETTADASADATGAESVAAPMSFVGQSDATVQSVQIVELHHGADGHDHGSEWIVIGNESAGMVNLAGWRLTDDGEKHVYTFPSFDLATGGRVNVYMARGDDGGDALYVGRNNRWWNNDGDCAYLYDASGALVDRHCYGNAVPAE